MESGSYLLFLIAAVFAAMAAAANPWFVRGDWRGKKGGRGKGKGKGKGGKGKGKGKGKGGVDDDLPLCNGCHCIREPNPKRGFCPPLPKTDYSKIIPALKAQTPKTPASNYGAIVDDMGNPCNPYFQTCFTAPARQDPTLVADPDNAVCGIKYDCGYCKTGCSEYELISYPSAKAAKKDGAFITHTAACGVCSSPSDLAVYMERAQTLDNDVPFMCVIPNLPLPLGTPPDVEDVANMIACGSQVLGLSSGCSQIWILSALSTFTSCLEECQPVIESNGTIPDIDPVTCELNDCLACDAENSQVIFDNFAGRNRKRSNILSSTPRSCSELPDITHKECSTVFRHAYY